MTNITQGRRRVSRPLQARKVKQRLSADEKTAQTHPPARTLRLSGLNLGVYLQHSHVMDQTTENDSRETDSPY